MWRRGARRVPGFTFGAPIVFAIDAVFIAAALGNPLTVGPRARIKVTS
jgi:hypothetical protein